MATHRRKPNRPAIKSNTKRMPIIDYSNTNRNHDTIVKIIKANYDEKEAQELIRDGKNVYFRIIDGDDEFTPEWFEAMCNEMDRQEIESIEHLHKKKKHMEKILLQSEMLKSYGFKETDYLMETLIMHTKQCGRFFICVIIDNTGDVYTEVNGERTTNCKYLHQLKRLVFILSGEKLEKA